MQKLRRRVRSYPIGSLDVATTRHGADSTPRATCVVRILGVRGSCVMWEFRALRRRGLRSACRGADAPRPRAAMRAVLVNVHQEVVYMCHYTASRGRFPAQESGHRAGRSGLPSRTLAPTSSHCPAGGGDERKTDLADSGHVFFAALRTCRRTASTNCWKVAVSLPAPPTSSPIRPSRVENRAK